MRTWALLLPVLLYEARGLRDSRSAQQQNMFNIVGDTDSYTGTRHKRSPDHLEQDSGFSDDGTNITTVFDLKDSHLHLMVHWAGKGSSIVFCLARPRDEEIQANSSSRLFISKDYGTTFDDVSSRFQLLSSSGTGDTGSSGGRRNATIKKFFHHPSNNCYYVFTDIFSRQIFVTRDCAETVQAIRTDFVPKHVEFDTKTEGRFLIHDQDSEMSSLFVTENYGISFTKVGDFVHSFFLHYSENTTSLYVARSEPSGSFNILTSSTFFKHIKENRLVFTGAVEFEMRDGLLFAVKNDTKNPEEKVLYVARPNQRFIVAEFPNNLPRRGYHVADVTAEGMVMLIVNHNVTYSNLYISYIVSEHEVKFSLSLERIMFYSPSTTWRNSWLAKLLENAPESESTFADFYKIAGLRSVYLASQLDQGVQESNIRPNNLSTLISFDAGGVWSPIAGPTTDHDGHPILGCYQETNCTLHIAQQLSRKYPATRSIPVLTSEAAPGVVLASGNMGRSLQTKTSVFLSADAGLSWHQVLQGNYYYNIGDHGGIIVAVKYFKTEGDTNILLYSTNEGLTWKSHKFYPTPIRIFGLITEPGENTTVFTMFGTKAKPGQPIDWIIVKVNLTSVFSRICTEEDYKDWSPQAPGEEKMQKCVMGKREVYRRRAPLAECFNGLDYTRARQLETCPCTQYDYRCDYGYIRDSGRSSKCVRDPNHDMEPEGGLPALCPPGTLYNLTKGYVRLVGDECEGGQSSWYEPEVRACPTDISAHRSFLLVAQRQQVVKIDLSEANSSMVLPLIGVENVIAMDLDYESDCIFWADIKTDKIVKQCLSNSSKVEVLVEAGLSSVEGMAFDQISKILYFVDGSRRTVELVKGNVVAGQHAMRKTILSTAQLGSKSKPRGIAVHPKQGYLFYSDWADKVACIGRALLDGSNHSIIVPTTNTRGQPQVKWPNGLTVDTVAERLYWVDAQLDYISSTDLDGANMKKVLAGRIEVSHPFAVAILKETVYWDDWTRKAVFQADKNTGSSISILKDNMPGAMDMKIFSPHLLTETNACSNHSCSHLCIALPPHTSPSYRCLCPDGMKAVGVGADTKCVCPNGQELFANGTCSATLVGGLCDNGTQFQCGNRLCIPHLWKCDGSNDCGDLSDEADCQADVCRGKQFQCANKKCIPDHWRCDFDQDCGDGSDELDCPSTACDTNTQFRCNNGQCINAKWRCDLEKDCHDGSDEAGCEATSVSPSCSSDHFQCPRGSQCLPVTWRCDGDLDCPDGSDETNCTAVDRCQDWQFRCASGHCVFRTWQCDGAPDCVDGSDELDCENVTRADGFPVASASPPTPNFPRGDCNEWMFKCGSEQCIPFWWKCDNVADCSDSSDEDGCGPDHETVLVPNSNSSSSAVEPAVLGCPAAKFQCHNGVCVWGSWVCDGDNDCPEGEDEDPEMCRDKVRCTPGQFMCQHSGTCVTIRAVCDGKKDCEDGSDELGCTPPAEGDSNKEHQVVCDEEENFMCDEGALCLTWDQKCDGHQDCLDGSDEEMCDHWREDVAVAALEEARDLITDHSVGVRWWPAPHSNFTHPNFTYKLGYTILEHRNWRNTSEEFSPMDQFEAEVGGLLPGTDYQIRLYVRNKVTGGEYHHAPVTVVRTRDGQPSPPRKLSAIQHGDVLALAWLPPSDPKGLILSYRLLIEKADGELLREERIPVAAAAARDPQSYNLTDVAAAGGPNYLTISLIAENRETASEPARLDQQLLHDSLGQLEILRLDEAAASLQWRGLPDLVSYTLSCRSDNPLDPPRSHITPRTNVSWSGLAPDTAYTFSVWGNKAGGGRTPISTIRVKTQGPGLPTPSLTVADLVPGFTTAVKLSWSLPPNSNNNNRSISSLSFGVWFGVSEEELLNGGPRSLVGLGATTWTERNLTACTAYIFAVAVLVNGAGGPGDSAGLIGAAGPRSNYRTVTTKFSAEAQPRQLTASGNMLTWQAPCRRLDGPLQYTVQLRDSVTGRETFTSLNPTRNISMRHTLTGLLEGQVVQATVGQGGPPRPNSPSVVVRGPPIAPPTSVYLQAEGGLLQVSWFKNGSVDPEVVYKVIFTPDESITKGCATRCAQCMPAKSSPLKANMSNLFDSGAFMAANCSGQVYTVAVAAVRTQKQGEYISSWIRAQRSLWPVELAQHTADQIVIEEANAVGTVIGVLIVISMLVAALGYMFYKHRRLRRSFQEFAATHYSSATGSATLLDDDDESPIIRGFSDDEPLVLST